jgi:transcriptional regulator with XRE-family HTH domain
MGRAPRQKPVRLGEKLVHIREAFELSQTGMIKYLGLAGVISRNNLSVYESGRREPSLLVLLKYAQAAGVCLDILVNDSLDLPNKIPSVPKHEVVAPTARKSLRKFRTNKKRKTNRE